MVSVYRKGILIFFSLINIASINASSIYVNKIGYLPSKVKYVYFSNLVDSFYVREQISGVIRFRGKAELWKEKDLATNLTLYRGDFSKFNGKGIFYITDNLGNKSSTFSISDTVFNEVYRKSLKYFYFQRCGIDLEQKHAGRYSHAKCHLLDGYFHRSTDTVGFKYVVGGWHDAGDYGKYIVNAGITVGTLLMAFELFPQKFSQDDLNIPESKNNIPDLLDEVKYELEWMLKMQNFDGGVYSKVTKERFEEFVMPQDDSPEGRYIYRISSTATADFAAVMARAYRIFNKYDKDFAYQCINAAKKAWNFLERNPDIVPLGGFKNPEGTITGEYGDKDDSDERLWASIELYFSTGNTKFFNYYESNYKKKNLFTTMDWGDVRTLAHLTFLTCQTELPCQTGLSHKTKEVLFSGIINEHKHSLENYCELLLSKSRKDGFNITILPGEYRWGSNSDVLNNAVILIFGYELLNKQDYYDTALMQLNYILGINAHDISFVTGVGDNSVMNPHHRPSAADGIFEPIPGLLAGGPNQYLDDPTLRSLFDSNSPPALCYVDDVGSWSSNETAINWNAPLVFVSGYFNEKVNPSEK